MGTEHLGYESIKLMIFPKYKLPVAGCVLKIYWIVETFAKF